MAPLASPSSALSFGRWPASTPWMVSGYAALGLGTFLLGPGPRELTLNCLNLAVFTHAGILSLHRSQREATAHWGWRAIALGLLAQAVNQGWAILHMLRHGVPPPFPSGGDLFSLLSLALFITSLLAWPLTSTTGSERLRKGVDGLGAALSAFLASWTFALGPLFHQSGSSSRERLALVAFFLGNATILGTCAYLGARSPSRFRGPLGWITLGFGMSTLQVVLQVPLSLGGIYHMGDPLDLLVLAAVLAIFLAPLARSPVEPGLAPGAEIRDRSLAALILPMLPSATGVLFVLGILLVVPARMDGVTLGLAATLAALGLLRGGLALRDLQQLSNDLESRVEARTQDLEGMQRTLLRTERMNAMAVLGAGMAHDLNNALAAIRAGAELARGRLEAGQTPEVKDLDHILVAAEQSAALTRRLMSYGRGDETRAERLDLREELAHMETILRMLIGRDITLELDLGAVALPITGSRGQIEQIIVNLVANARDAMPEGGAIRLRLSLSVAGGQPVARVEVEDTGIGMTPEVQAGLFRPFFTTKGPGRGTGLGLASVRQLMHDLNGTLAVASQPGVGTTFVLRFPLVEG